MMRLAFQGEPGAFSEAAAQTYAAGACLLPRHTFAAVFDAVVNRHVDAGILPIENSVAGAVAETWDLLLTRDLPITGEVEIQIDHCLLASAGTNTEHLRVVYSHPHALLQCERLLTRLRAAAASVSNTALAARLVAERARRDEGALASRRAADVFGLEVLLERVQDFAENRTRFVIVGGPAPVVRNKATVAFTLAPGADVLTKVIDIFTGQGLGIARLGRRPDPRRPLDDIFFADLDGALDAAWPRASQSIAPYVRSLRVLGSYARWRRGEPATDGLVAAPTAASRDRAAAVSHLAE